MGSIRSKPRSSNITETLGKFLPDTDRPNAGVFSLQDDDEQWMSLRYDLTAPLARHFAENFERLPKPYRSYRQGWVFRNEKPGPGRFRQFMQFDADTVGAAGPEADAEMCMMMADTMDALGLGGEVRGQGQQPQGARWRAGAVGLGGDDRRWQTAHCPASHRQARPVGRRGRSARCSAKVARTRAAISPPGAGLDDASDQAVLDMFDLQG